MPSFLVLCVIDRLISLKCGVVYFKREILYPRVYPYCVAFQQYDEKWSSGLSKPRTRGCSVFVVCMYDVLCTVRVPTPLHQFTCCPQAFGDGGSQLGDGVLAQGP
jgi:hypothetical protein